MENETPSNDLYQESGDSCCLLNEQELDTEFIYYSMLIKNLVPSISNEKDRTTIKAWVERLFGPEYQSCLFNEKRNKYLLHIVLSLMNDDLSELLKVAPPKGALPPLETVKMCAHTEAEWESDKLWEDMIHDMNTSLCPMKCSIHSEDCSQREPTIADSLLDSEFRFLLYLAKPYVSLLDHPDDKLHAASWIQTLCSIQEKSCPGMKGIRNDYMQALCGYLQDLRITGPFQDYPSATQPLLPLHEEMKRIQEKYSFTNPASYEANNFLRTQPPIRNGAVCFLAVSGELLTSNILDSVN
ncbi:hypothetical protein M8J76_012672 [Diaphorina citri]|nr:hypothetical protein M8J75_014464 [Diaphorina citri]KAI5745611.1 hypothetical protein M8J76_012672 [Diaphorina citri]